MNKGDKVVAVATVQGGYFVNDLPKDSVVVGRSKYVHGRLRLVVRVPLSKAVHGVVVGESHRLYGNLVVHGEDGWDAAGDLSCQGRVKVVMVQPTYTRRYLKPIACLPSDVFDTELWEEKGHVVEKAS